MTAIGGAGWKRQREEEEPIRTNKVARFESKGNVQAQSQDKGVCGDGQEGKRTTTPDKVKRRLEKEKRRLEKEERSRKRQEKREKKKQKKRSKRQSSSVK